MIEYLTVERSEGPVVSEAWYFDPGLPAFAKGHNPLSGASPVQILRKESFGPVRIESLLGKSEAAVAIAAKYADCTVGHERVLKQRLTVEQVVVTRYDYAVDETPYRIYLGGQAGAIEDLDGPIQRAIAGLDDSARSKAGAGDYADACRLNLTAQLMDEASDAERVLHASIRAQLLKRVSVVAAGSWLLCSAAIMSAGRLPPDSPGWIALLSAGVLLIPMVRVCALALVFLTSRGRELWALAAGLGALTAFSAAPLYVAVSSDLSIRWEVLPLMLLAAGGAILTYSSRQTIRLAWDATRAAQLLQTGAAREQFVHSLAPDAARLRQCYQWILCLLAACLMHAGARFFFRSG